LKKQFGEKSSQASHKKELALDNRERFVKCYTMAFGGLVKTQVVTMLDIILGEGFYSDTEMSELMDFIPSQLTQAYLKYVPKSEKDFLAKKYHDEHAVAYFRQLGFVRQLSTADLRMIATQS
jgi:hypothetical protein